MYRLEHSSVIGSLQHMRQKSYRPLSVFFLRIKGMDFLGSVERSERGITLRAELTEIWRNKALPK